MTRNPRCTLTLPLLAAALAAGSLFAAASAGPLNPPAGAIASTAKPLAEVEPRIAINATNTPGDADSVFKITQPGSYYLTGNITDIIARHGIEIAASGVTVDLRGFELRGVAIASAFDGITVSLVDARNITVRNGSVRQWGADGVDLRGSNLAAGTRIENITASGNLGGGLLAGNGSSVTGCTSSDNGGVGIAAGTGSTVADCASFDNTGIGIATGNGSAITACTAYSNGSSGISVTNGCTVTGCTAAANSLHGIVSGSGCTISGCTAYINQGSGIVVSGTGSLVEHCTARASTLDGIVIAARCTVRSCVASNNGNGGDGAGIHATGDGNRIEGNHFYGADRGLDIDDTGNVIVRNTASSNTINWVIVAGNHFGPIIDRTAAAASPAVNGSAAGGVNLGTTDPNANFTH